MKIKIDNQYKEATLYIKENNKIISLKQVSNYFVSDTGMDGSGTIDDPYISTDSYIPGQQEANTVILYENNDGVPKVGTDSLGRVNYYEMTNVSTTNRLILDGTNPVDTGYILFDGENDWQLTMQFTINPANQTQSYADILSAIKWERYSGGTRFISGFEFRLAKSNRMLQFYFTSNGSTGSTKSLRSINNNIGSRILLNITKSGDNISSTVQGLQGTTFSKISYSWTDSGNTSDIDLRIGCRESSTGNLTYLANIQIEKFKIERT